MDIFEEGAASLEGGLLSLEFTQAGRISKLWAYDPALPDEGEDFQFCLPTVTFGEETSDSYLPGTILIGARTGPDQPWIVSRNSEAQNTFNLEDAVSGEDQRIRFDYSFPFLDDIEASGTFYEELQPYPQIIWDVEIRNTGRQTLEIGEVGFPLAFNTLYDGFGWSDEQLEKLWASRVYVHKFIGGASSWMFAQRMTAQPPGLLVYPGDDTSWEFFASVPGSLTTPFQWEGIPVVYAHSRATIEREQWPEWMNGHTSLILEPGDKRTFQMRFTSIESDRVDGISQTLSSVGRPVQRLLPGAVVPMGVGIGVEINRTPTRIMADRPVQVDTDIDEETGFLLVRSDQPGPVRLSIDTSAGTSYCHLFFTPPMEKLINVRADYIVKNQVIRATDSPLDHAVVMANVMDIKPVAEREEYFESSGLEGSIADALFLAEKNSIYPDRNQIELLDDYIEKFLLVRVQNPATGAVASALDEVAAMGEQFGRPLGYPHVMNLYRAMYRIAGSYGETLHSPLVYLKRAYLTAMALFRFGWRHYVRTVGLLGYPRIYELLDELRAAGLTDEAAALEIHVQAKAEELTEMRAPYAGESVMDTSGLEEVFAAAKFLADDAHLERTVKCAFAARSLAPSWWWYGSDKRHWDGADSAPLKALLDRAEACLGQTTIPNSLIFFGLMDRDYLAIPDAYMRMAFGGLLGPWALVGEEGQASMCFVPDLASKSPGANAFTGASGLGYAHYLGGMTSLVLPGRGEATATVGCHFEADNESYRVKPWDGVGRRIVLRQIGVSMSISFGICREFILARDKRTFIARIENPSDKDVMVEIALDGLWGSQVRIGEQTVKCEDGVARHTFHCPAQAITDVTGNVVA